jgi:hypothetical protein
METNDKAIPKKTAELREDGEPGKANADGGGGYRKGDFLRNINTMHKQGVIRKEIKNLAIRLYVSTL